MSVHSGSYVITSAEDGPSLHPSMLYAESTIEIGTTLVLEIANGTENKQTIMGVNCESKPVPFAKVGQDLKEISILITNEYSGKLISVHVVDPDLHLTFDPNDNHHIVQSDIFLPLSQTLNFSQAYIFQRVGTILTSCTAGPAGTSSGSYGATDISAYESKIGVSKSMRRLLSTPTHDDSVFLNSITVQNNHMKIVNIAGDSVRFSALDPLMDFSIDV